MDVIDRVPKLVRIGGAHVKQRMQNKLLEHEEYIHIHGADMPEILNWKWTYNE
jgi:xylulose-5-phosphate/fructose-6-phosphate phosphoketolase